MRVCGPPDDVVKILFDFFCQVIDLSLVGAEDIS